MPAAERLVKLLNSLDETIEIAGVLPSIEKAVQWFGNNDFPDIILMDIELSDGRCFEIFNRIQISSPVIFTTAYDQFAIKAIKLNALDYLLKPIDKTELEEALAKIKKIPERNETPKFAALVEYITNVAQNRKPKKLAIKDAQSTRFIEISNITRFQADSNYTIIYMDDGSKIITTRTLKEYEDILTDSGFFRVHNAHFINLNYVEKFYKDSNTIEMKDGSSIDVSRSKKKELFAKLGAN